MSTWDLRNAAAALATASSSEVDICGLPAAASPLPDRDCSNLTWFTAARHSVTRHRDPLVDPANASTPAGRLQAEAEARERFMYNDLDIHFDRPYFARFYHHRHRSVVFLHHAARYLVLIGILFGFVVSKLGLQVPVSRATVGRCCRRLEELHCGRSAGATAGKDGGDQRRLYVTAAE